MRERLLHLRAQVLGVLLIIPVVVSAHLGRNREAGRDRQSQVGHFGQSGALAAQQIAHRGFALGAAVAKAIDPLALSRGSGGCRFRLGRRSLAYQPFFAFCRDARTFSFSHWSTTLEGRWHLKAPPNSRAQVPNSG